MLTLDTAKLTQVVTRAKADAAQHPRWITAISRAARELESNPYIEVQDDHLLIASPSGNLYAANGICQCVAFQHNQPCWHRAAGRLVRRYQEAERARAGYEQALTDVCELFAS